MKQRMSNKTFRKIWIPIISVLVFLCVLATVAMNVLSDYMNDYLGRGDKIINTSGENETVSYYDKATDDRNVSKETSYKTALKVSEEGMVLLKNNGVLPLATGSEVTPYGYRYKEPIYGQVSSGGSAKWVIDPVTPAEGLADTLKVNNAAADKMSGTPKGLTEAEGTLSAGDVAGSLLGGDSILYEYDPSVYDGVTGVSGTTALVFVARAGQEGSDKKYDGYSDGTPHYLAFTFNELGTIKKAKEQCGKVVVLVEASTMMEYAPVIDPDSEYCADAVIIVGHQGERGFEKLDDVLTGAVNPSGKTVDIHATDFTADPTYANFGEFKYSGLNDFEYYIEYQEDVYMGYRYYETADVEDPDFVYGTLDEYGAIDEAGEVTYPFGYGLSYTTFRQELTGEPTVSDGVVTVEYKVTNTGSVKGKEVVQLYYTPPYTDFDKANKIEKPVKNLVAFDKVEVSPGEENAVTGTLSFSLEDMASYCMSHANPDGTSGCYVLEGADAENGSGEYILTLGKNSHDAWDTAVVTVENTVWYDGSDEDHIRDAEKDAQSALDDNGEPTGVPDNRTVDPDAEFIAATNRFEDSTEYMYEQSSVLTRTNWKGSKPVLNTSRTKSIPSEISDTFGKETDFDVKTDPILGNVSGSKVYTDKMPVSGAANGLLLSDMRGKDFYHEDWNKLLDQINYDAEKSDLVNLLTAANYSTVELKSIGLSPSIEADGANGIKKVKTDAGMTLTATYGYAPLMASTWNVELLYEVGVQFAQESLTVGVNGWYSPAINLHRSPFSGRNFEYYSEDPVLTGKLATAVISGAGDNGLVCFVKHFAVNDQETRRSEYLHTWATEQAMRELYFKAFELPVRNARMTIKYIGEDGETKEKTMRATSAIMCAQNDIGSMIAHANYALVTELLRGEWGFNGFVLTDMYGATYRPHHDLTLRAGTDGFLSALALAGLEDTASATARTAMRNAVHHIAFAFANSNMLEGVPPGATMTYGFAPWAMGLLIGNIVVYAFVIFVIVMGVLRHLDARKHPENYKTSVKR